MSPSSIDAASTEGERDASRHQKHGCARLGTRHLSARSGRGLQGLAKTLETEAGRIDILVNNAEVGSGGAALALMERSRLGIK